MTDDKQRVVISTRDGRTTCDPLFAESWSDFERIADVLRREFSARLVDAFDGPDARRWIFRLSEGTIEVHHDDMGGNVVVSMSAETDALVERIGYALERSLKTS